MTKLTHEEKLKACPMCGGESNPLPYPGWDTKRGSPVTLWGYWDDLDTWTDCEGNVLADQERYKKLGWRELVWEKRWAGHGYVFTRRRFIPFPFQI